MKLIDSIPMAYRIGFAHAFSVGNELGSKLGDRCFHSRRYMARELGKFYFECGVYKADMVKTRRMFRAFIRGFNECSQLIMEVQNG